MFLIDRPRSRTKDEGSALIAVIGVMAVAMIVSVAVASATMSSLSFTGATRASVQAQSAAEAGIAHTEAQLSKACTKATFTDADIVDITNPSEYPEGFSVDFSVEVYHSATETGSDWASGCGTAGTKRIKLVSAGTATSVGLPANATGDRRVIETIYSVLVAETFDAAIYAYSAPKFQAAGKILPYEDSSPSVLLRHGDVECDGGAEVAADLIAAEGSIKISGSCHVSGDVWASGTVSTSGNVKVDGDITSMSTATDSMSLTGVHVLGDAWAAGTMKVTWGTTVDGNATAKSLDLAGGNIRGEAWSAGSANFGGGANIDGHLTAKSTNSSNSARGGATIIPAGPGPGPAAGPTPVVPDWIDFDYDKADWVGFNEVKISGSCDYSQFNAAVAALASAPGIIDARGCKDPVQISSYQELALRNDLAIIAKGFDLGGSAGFTSSSERKLWLISPDTVADGKPTCPPRSSTVGSFTVGGRFKLDKEVKAMIYSPCSVSIASGIEWYGQVYSGSTTISGSARLYFVSVGIPGVNLSEGTHQPAGSTGGLGERVSIRDLGSNG